MAILPSDVADILNTTIATYDRKKFSEIAITDQKHYFLPTLIGSNNVVYDSGSSIKFDVMHDVGSGARHIGLFDKDQISVDDVMAQGDVPWMRTVRPFAWDVHEVAVNREKSKIVSLAQTRQAAAFGNLSNLVEAAGWGIPASDDGITPFGVKYWMVKSITGTSAATSTGGFNGGNNANFSSGCAGLSSTTYPTWANWAQAYVDITKDDLVTKMRTAKHYTDFMSPMKGKYTENTKGPDQYVIYMPYPTLRSLEIVAEQQNENLKNDIASMDGETVFHRIPMRAVTNLESDSDNPIYFINWSVFYIVLLKGQGLTQTPVAPIAGQSQTVGGQYILTWNTKCVNRRRLAVLSTAADND